ncbi:MAG: hypothetical protein LBD17_02905 [Endomicrobium sp.]|jgi:transposase|nr:hypothetical protein [Endomicrobium sp.]
MAKSDLKARPIFHQKRDSIEAHLTVCWAALGICRHIQDKTKISIKKFVRKLSRFKTAVVEISGKEHIANPKIVLKRKNL